jgi:hypothetical protein
MTQLIRLFGTFLSLSTTAIAQGGSELIAFSQAASSLTGAQVFCERSGSKTCVGNQMRSDIDTLIRTVDLSSYGVKCDG